MKRFGELFLSFALRFAKGGQAGDRVRAFDGCNVGALGVFRHLDEEQLRVVDIVAPEDGGDGRDGGGLGSRSR